MDTLDRNSTAMDLIPIMNLFNEWHAANTSGGVPEAVTDAVPLPKCNVTEYIIKNGKLID